MGIKTIVFWLFYEKNAFTKKTTYFFYFLILNSWISVHFKTVRIVFNYLWIFQSAWKNSIYVFQKMNFYFNIFFQQVLEIQRENDVESCTPQNVYTCIFIPKKITEKNMFSIYFSALFFILHKFLYMLYFLFFFVRLHFIVFFYLHFHQFW